MIAQTKTVVTENGEKLVISPYANNGLETHNGYIQLGGALTKPSILATTSTFTLAFTGLQTGSTSDNVLVTDSNGILKSVPRSGFGGNDNLGNHIATMDLNMSSKNITNIFNAYIKNELQIFDRNTLKTNYFGIYKNNGLFGIWNSSKAANALTIDEATNYVGIGTTAPTNTLHIKATADPVKIEGLSIATGTDNYSMVITGDGVVKKTEIQAAPEVGTPVQLVASAGFNSESDAFVSSDLGAGIKQLIFKGPRFDPKSSYNNNTGVFTAPETGYYKFECVMLMYNNTGGIINNVPVRVGISKVGQLTFSNGNSSFSSLNQIILNGVDPNYPIVIPYSGMQKMNKGEQCIFGSRYFGNYTLQVSKINYDVTTSSYMSITYMGN